MEEKKQAGRPKKVNLSTEKKIERLEFVVRKIAHFSGNNRILIEAGLDVWAPGKNDMKKFKD